MLTLALGGGHKKEWKSSGLELTIPMMHPEWQGGGQFRGHFDPIFLHNFDWGTKITKKKNSNKFLAQKMLFLRTFSLTGDNSGFTS